MRIFISTGEVSGDLQGSLLVTALKRQGAASGLNLEIIALGGEKMAAAGATLLENTTSIGSFGILEAVPFLLPTFLVQRQTFAHFKQHPPDLVVLIDYMGLNISVGNYIRRHLPQVPVVYYIAPQTWVSSATARDTAKILGVCDKLLAIFPEEARYFQNRGADVSWVGHPLVDRMENFPSRETARFQLGIKDDAIAIALVPASRRQELKYLLPVMFQAAQEIQSKLPHVHFWIPLSLEIYREQIEKEIQNYGLSATIISHQQQQVLAGADLAITKCGTVNLELALLNVPQVVLYRLHPLTYWIAKRILKITFPFASPVNLMVMKGIVPEFIQSTATPENIIQSTMELLLNYQNREQMQADYQEMREKMGDVGVCDRAAQEILQLL
ncbi:MAG: lipid-A-disaccharide synthase [Calothrix sp. MO_167.B42]|nr:lipid-A-disaccharide synthase [Calothrix sp. MO_167.B42]